MSKNPLNTRESRAAQFVGRRIYELRARKSQAEIAIAAGFKSPGMLSMIKDGKAKLPLERVVDLARALECDPSRLARLALEQSLSQPILDQIFSGSPVSKNEQAILDEVRAATSIASDPELTAEQKRLLNLAFTPPGTTPLPSPPDYAVWALTLGLAVRAAQRELRIGKQFIVQVASRSQRVEQRLGTLRSALDDMLVEAKAAAALARSSLGTEPPVRRGR